MYASMRTMPKMCAAAAVLMAVFGPGAVFAEEVIHAFDVTVEVRTDRMLTVTERIRYNFAEFERHGIFRTIPTVSQRDGFEYRLRPEVVSVRTDGVDAPFTVSRERDAIEIKIGDAEKTVRGEHMYEITYRTDRAITFFPDHDEVYWNVTGNGWPVAIEDASVEIVPPEGTHPAALDAVCFTGVFGSRDAECVRQDGPRVFLETTAALAPEEGFTVAISFPKGIIHEPTARDRLQTTLADNGHLALPVLLFFALLALWFKKGRDPGVGTVIPLYEPPDGLSPAEIGMVRENGAVSLRLLAAAILYLAERGYVAIRAEKKEKVFGSSTVFSLEKMGDADGKLSPEDAVLMNGLFKGGKTVKFSDLQTSDFSSTVQKIYRMLIKRFRERRVFRMHPATVRSLFVIAAMAISGPLILILATRPYGALVGVVCMVLIIAFGWVMPRLTPEGAKLYGRVKGFELFLSVAMKDRLAFHDAPGRSSGQFHELLPYAIALGVEREWARQFEGIDLSPPQWAKGGGWSMRSPSLFVSSVRSFSSGFSTGTQTSGGSGFSGGGSSGGGGGGGGGGSW